MSINSKSVKNSLFGSALLNRSSISAKIAYIGVFTAVSVIANTLLEFRIFDVQFSLTIFFSALIGVFLGPVFGFCACFIGDFVGYALNSWGQLYMPWVGISTGVIAFLAGVIIGGLKEKSFTETSVRLIVFFCLSFIICTVGINSTGFYLYNKNIGFSTAVVNYVTNRFGGDVSYFGYVAYRLIFKGQIWNNVANYALLFVVLPTLREIKPLRVYL